MTKDDLFHLSWIRFLFSTQFFINFCLHHKPGNTYSRCSRINHVIVGLLQRGNHVSRCSQKQRHCWSEGGQWSSTRTKTAAQDSATSRQTKAALAKFICRNHHSGCLSSTISRVSYHLVWWWAKGGPFRGQQHKKERRWRRGRRWSAGDPSSTSNYYWCGCRTWT